MGKIGYRRRKSVNRKRGKRQMEAELRNKKKTSTPEKQDD